MTRVLLVDDDEAMLFAFKRLAETSPLILDTTDTLESATHLLTHRHYDIVIADLNLTGPDGQEGIEIVRIAKQQNPSVRTVVWTAYEGGDIQRRVMEAGADVCLIKPVRYDTIRSVIESQTAAQGKVE